jgi:hypothetical protein
MFIEILLVERYKQKGINMTTHTIGSRGAIITQKVYGKTSSVIGYTHLGFGVLGLIFEITGDQDNFGVGLAIFFIVVGTLFIYNGIRIKRRIHRFKHYVSIISGLQITNLESIGVQTGKPVTFVRDELQKMINKRFFRNASIDTIKGEIVIPGIYTIEQNSAVSLENYNCLRCGATGVREVGSTPICEYCGSVTSGR